METFPLVFISFGPTFPSACSQNTNPERCTAWKGSVDEWGWGPLSSEPSGRVLACKTSLRNPAQKEAIHLGKIRIYWTTGNSLNISWKRYMIPKGLSVSSKQFTNLFDFSFLKVSVSSIFSPSICGGKSQLRLLLYQWRVTYIIATTRENGHLLDVETPFRLDLHHVGNSTVRDLIVSNAPGAGIFAHLVGARCCAWMYFTSTVSL